MKSGHSQIKSGHYAENDPKTGQYRLIKPVIRFGTAIHSPPRQSGGRARGARICRNSLIIADKCAVTPCGARKMKFLLLKLHKHNSAFPGTVSVVARSKRGRKAATSSNDGDR
ncbi:MAG TPA: hypothetical protein VHT03_11835 [Rhizomicrobium sp.]|jgi:hypothetical protein|nr:hypothetical protein [Rhizomicrobium sp.]